MNVLGVRKRDSEKNEKGEREMDLEDGDGLAFDEIEVWEEIKERTDESLKELRDSKHVFQSMIA